MASQDRRMSFDRIHPNNRVEDDQSDDEVPSNDEESRSSPAASPERAHVNEAFESDEPQPLDPAPTLEGDGQHQEAGPSRRRSLIDEADNVSILTQRRGSNPVALQDRAANPDPPRRIQPAEEPERRLEPAEEPVRRFEPANEPPRRFQPAEEAERQGAEWDSPPPDYNEANKYNVNPPSYEFAVAARQIDPSHIRAPHEQQRARDVRVEMPAAAAPPPPRRPGRPSGQQLELFPTERVRSSASNTGPRGKRSSLLIVGVAFVALLVLIGVFWYVLASRAHTTLSPAEHNFDILLDSKTTTTTESWTWR